MNVQLIAVMLQEGGKLVSEFIRTRPLRRRAQPEEPLLRIAEELEPETPQIATGCVPCALGHYSTCTGLLNEAMRFAREDGLSDDVITRVNRCLDELNAMEREDLRPEMLVGLSIWEKELAEEALSGSRQTRHQLEGIATVDELEQIAANTQTVREKIGKTWFKKRLATMSPQEKVEMRDKVMEKLENLEDDQEKDS